MSFAGQAHHPHTRGGPPNAALIGVVTDGEDYIPKGLELVQAHWFVRHGERTPVRKRLTGAAGLPPIYPLCATGRQFSTAVLSLAPAPYCDPSAEECTPEEGKAFEGQLVEQRAFQEPFVGHMAPVEGKEGVRVGRMEVRRLTEEMGEGNEAVAGGMADCYWGELTDLGRQSTLELGTRLRTLYVDQLGFLPSSLPDEPLATAPITFRSTGMPRTIESLHQIAAGLFPEGKRDGPVEYAVRNPMDESLYPNSLCMKMRRMDRKSAELAAETHNPSLLTLDHLLSKYLNGQPIRIDGTPRANGVLDTVMVCRAHGIKVPEELEDVAVLEVLERAVVHEWFDAYTHPEFRRLSMGRLLGDLRTVMEKKVGDPKEKTEKLRLAVYSAHDTSLGGILNSLDVFDSRWPPFTSHISFELFRSASRPSFFASFLPSFLTPTSSADHFVRMRYNAKPIVLPSCAKPGMHLEGSRGEVCTWEGFKEALRKIEMTGKEWETSCAQ